VWVLTQQGVGFGSKARRPKGLNCALVSGSRRSLIYSNISLHTCVVSEGKRRDGPGRGDNPALRPAFRVRRGSHLGFGSTTGYVGSRASGYPPDLVSFRRCAGAPADCVRLRWGSGVLALQARWGELSGNPRGRAGRPSGLTSPIRREQFTADSSADARDPTSSTTSSIRSLKWGTRSWSIERTDIHRCHPGQRQRPSHSGSAEPYIRAALNNGFVEPLFMRRTIFFLRHERWN